MEKKLLIDILLWVVALPAGWLAGRVLKATVFPPLHKFARRTNNSVDDALVTAVEKVIVPLFWVVGVWVAYHWSGLFPDYKPNIKKGIIVFSILCVTWAAAYLVNELAKMYLFRIGKSLPESSIFTVMIKIGVYVLGILFIMHYLNIPIAPALTALGVGGLAVALALQDTLSNLFSGLQMLAAKKLKPGDYVKLDNGDEGFVEDISWRNTTVRALGNHIIIVPNSTMAGSIVKNFILPDSQNSVLVPVGVAYDSDLKEVERITIEVGREIQQSVEGAVPDHEPFIRYNEFGDSSINFNIILRAGDFVSQYLMKHEFIKALHARYEKEGIEIPFPIRTVHLKKEE
ncbi:mechanosensitive ion channel family protein [Jiulongibacter sp. NS-SX5]|uniref:mechanosensitive ion channel family protein n=1 Tax=Jiulongibacter sp. NS-SX5 TaxID=3463854 RepID=UPI004057DEA5